MMFAPRRLSVLAVAVALGLGGCAQTKLAVHTAKSVQTPTNEELGIKRQGRYKVGDPYQIGGVWYYPAEDPNYDQTGIASWYGEQFHGRQTANGENYDMNELTAAHQTLPMPSFVRVTNLENGRSIVVRVNDRGPFANSRIIDMSRRSAQLLGFERQGTAKVRVQAVATPDTEPGVMIAAAPTDNEKPPVSAAPRRAVSAESLAPPPGARGQTTPVTQPPPPPPPAVAILGTQAQNQTPQQLGSQSVQQMAVKPTNIFVQAGAFSQYDNANRLKARLSVLGPTQVTQVNVRGIDLFRVRLGPLENVEQADQALAQVIAIGQTDARIVVD